MLSTPSAGLQAELWHISVNKITGTEMAETFYLITLKNATFSSLFLSEQRFDSLRVFLMLLTVMDLVLVFLGLPERLLFSIMRPSFLNFLIIY